MKVVNSSKHIVFSKKNGGAIIKRVKYQGMCGWRETDTGEGRVLVFGHKPNGEFYERDAFKVLMINVRRERELNKRAERLSAWPRLLRSVGCYGEPLPFTKTVQA